MRCCTAACLEQGANSPAREARMHPQRTAKAPSSPCVRVWLCARPCAQCVLSWRRRGQRCWRRQPRRQRGWRPVGRGQRAQRPRRAGVGLERARAAALRARLGGWLWNGGLPSARSAMSSNLQAATQNVRHGWRSRGFLMWVVAVGPCRPAAGRLTWLRLWRRNPAARLARGLVPRPLSLKIRASAASCSASHDMTPAGSAQWQTSNDQMGCARGQVSRAASVPARRFRVGYGMCGVDVPLWNRRAVGGAHGVQQ
jgi:hypothetical protein